MQEAVLHLCSLRSVVCLFPRKYRFWGRGGDTNRSRDWSLRLEILSTQPGDCMHALAFVCRLEESSEVMSKGSSRCARRSSQVSRPVSTQPASLGAGLGQEAKSTLGTTKTPCFTNTETSCPGSTLLTPSHLWWNKVQNCSQIQDQNILFQWRANSSSPHHWEPPAESYRSI